MKLFERVVNVLLVITAIVVLVALGFGVKLVWGAEVELVRELTITDEVKADIEKNIQEMMFELEKQGCLTVQWMAFASFHEKPKLVVAMRCVAWAEGVPYAPSKR